MKFRMPKQLVFGWTLSMFMIVATYYIETIPPKFTEFFEGDIALSYSVHDAVPYRVSLLLNYGLDTNMSSFHVSLFL